MTEAIQPIGHVAIQLGDRLLTRLRDVVEVIGKENVRFVGGYPAQLAHLDSCLCGLDVERMAGKLGYAVRREPGMLFVLTKEG